MWSAVGLFVLHVGGLYLAREAISLVAKGFKRDKPELLQLLGEGQKRAAERLAQALAELVARAKNRGIDSYELYRNLEKLLPLLCLDASHRRVADQVHAAISDVARRQHRAMRRGKHKIRIDSAGQLRLLLLWDPECAEVFRATKVNSRKVDNAAPKNRGHLKQFSWVEIALLSRVTEAEKAFRKSVEGIFDRAKEMHETQKKLAEALLDYLGLVESSASDEACVSKRLEVEELRDKLQELSVPDRRDSRKNPHARGNVDDIAVLSVEKVDPAVHKAQWSRAAYPLLLLADRFHVDQPLERTRDREIAKLFDALGATDAERKEIEEPIGIIYKIIHKRWSKDSWIKQVERDVFPTRRRRKLSRLSRRTNRPSPFSNFLYRGWWKTTSKRRLLFLKHHSTFELKSPRRLTEEGVLGMVQTMEDQEDKIFTRTSRLNRELQEIYDLVQENTRHGKFDAVIADLKILVNRVSGRGKEKSYPPEMVSQICSYLAFMYAYRGEHLGEAVRLAQRAMRIHDTWLTRLAIGWCYHRQGKVRKAVKELEVAKSAASHAGSGLLPLVYLVLGDACWDAKWNRKAQQAWQEGRELADALEWKEQPGLTPFEVAERAGLQKALSERSG